MPSTLIFLLFLAAALHTTWNWLLKTTGQDAADRRVTYIISWLALLFGAVCFAPAVFINPLTVAVWPYLLISAFLNTLYFAALSAAYHWGDFSVVYPISRGTAPALLALWAVLFLHEKISNLGMLGLACIIAGLLFIGLNGWNLNTLVKSASRKSLALALGLAVLISIYSVVDGAAMRLATPIAYNTALHGLAALMITPIIYRKSGWAHIIEVSRRYGWRACQIGALMMFTYVLVLYVYTKAQVSYAGAIREMSIVFAAFIGWRMGEGFGKARIAGAILMFIGILLISLTRV